MTALQETQWQKLGEPPKGDDELVARVADPDTTDRVLIAVDGLARRHLLVPLKAGEQELRDSESRGIHAVSRELTVPGVASGRYIDVRLMEESGRDAFNLVAGDCIAGIAPGKSEPAKVIGRVISKWRRFWRSLPSGLLSFEQQIGLFAEVWFLTVWLVPRFGTTSVRSWRGPHGSRHDFEWPDQSVEVKATTVRRGPVFRISSLEQLEPPASGALHFFGIQLRDEAGGQQSLPKIIAQAQRAFLDDPEALDAFEVALSDAGYLAEHQDQYARLALRIADEALYKVTAEFPRLNRADLPSHSAQAIEEVQYQVNLASHANLIVAKKPSGFLLNGF